MIGKGDVFIQFRLENGELRGYVLENPDDREPLACLCDVPPHLTIKGSELHMQELSHVHDFEYCGFVEVPGLYYVPPIPPKHDLEN